LKVQDMKKQKSLIGKIIAETSRNEIPLPWARGARRAEWIAKRALQSMQEKPAKA